MWTDSILSIDKNTLKCVFQVWNFFIMLFVTFFPLGMLSGNHISLINFLLLQKGCFSFAKTIALLLWKDIVTIKCVNKVNWVIFEGHLWQLLENTNIVCQIAVKLFGLICHTILFIMFYTLPRVYALRRQDYTWFTVHHNSWHSWYSINTM